MNASAAPDEAGSSCLFGEGCFAARLHGCNGDDAAADLSDDDADEEESVTVAGDVAAMWHD